MILSEKEKNTGYSCTWTVIFRYPISFGSWPGTRWGEHVHFVRSQGPQHYQPYNVLLNLFWGAQIFVHQKTWFFQPWLKKFFVILTPLPERRGLTVFQKSFLSVILFKSRLLRYFFFSLLYSLVQKCLYCLKSFNFSFDLVLKYLCCSSVLFIIAFLIYFVTNGAWLGLIVLF